VIVIVPPAPKFQDPNPPDTGTAEVRFPVVKFNTQLKHATDTPGLLGVFTPVMLVT
jgi:hypothetical protein